MSVEKKMNRAAILLSALLAFGWLGAISKDARADLKPTGTVIRQVFDGASGVYGRFRIIFDGSANNYAVFGSSRAPFGSATGAVLMSSGSLVAQSTTATAGHKFFELLNNAGTEVLSVAQSGAFNLTGVLTATSFQGDGSAMTGIPGLNSSSTYTGSNTFGNLTSSTTFNNLGIVGASAGGFFTAPTRQVFLSGTSQTYTTPYKARQLRIRMVAGGGGGGGGNSGGGAGGTGGTTSFNSITCIGGSGGAAATGGVVVGPAGGTGGTGTASYRIPGQNGASTNGGLITGPGGASAMGPGAGYVTTTSAGLTASANGGGGGSGGSASGSSGPSGGGGEYAEIIINSPGASYTYAVGAGGAGGTSGVGGTSAGGAGAAGIIIVDEFY